MDSKGGINRAEFHATVAAVRRHPDFATARHRFCTDVPASRLHNYFRHTLAADTGAFALANTITGLNRVDKVNGAAMTTVVQALAATGFASATRTRSLIAQMQDKGLIRIVPNLRDARRKRLELTDPFIAAHRDWFEAVLNAVSLIFTLPGTPHYLAQNGDLTERYMTSIMMRTVVDGFVLMEGMPEIDRFMQRRHGYLLMLELAGAAASTAFINRAALAERFQVTPAHISAMLAEAEAAGWLHRRPQSSEIELSPGFAEQLGTWIARELAIVGMWIATKFGTDPKPKNS